MFVCPEPPRTPAPRADRPHYDLRFRVERDLKFAEGTVAVRFTPNRPTQRVVFRLWPNGPRQRGVGMRLTVGRPTVDGKPVRATRPDPTTLVLHRPVRRSESVTIRMSWRLRVATGGLDRIARWRGGVRLGSFYPVLPWDVRRGWVTDPPALVIGESSTSPTADYDVHVTAPPGMRAFVSGTRVASGRWHAHAVRDIGVAVGRFDVATGTAHAPNAVHVTAATSGRAQRPHAVLSLAETALRNLSRRYGPYRWSSYTMVATPDFSEAGIEYPTFVFLGRGSFLGPIVEHETAHQWFYSLVGNDQARDPWLDEALATWAEIRLGGGLSPHLRTRGDVRHVGAAMSFFTGRPDAYFREVYGGGAHALGSLRSDARVDCGLKLYAARNAYSIARPRDLLAALDRVIPGAARRLRRFGIHG